MAESPQPIPARFGALNMVSDLDMEGPKLKLVVRVAEAGGFQCGAEWHSVVECS